MDFTGLSPDRFLPREAAVRIMYERLTGQARRVLWLAYQEAERFDHDFLGTEHLLIGIVREGSPDILAILRQHGIEPDHVLTQVDPVLLAAEPSAMAGKVFLTPRVRHILAQAIEAADRAHLGQAGVVHLLDELLADQESATQRILDEIGVDLEGLRRHLKELPAPGNRDLAVRTHRIEADATRVDPSPEQLAQLLGERMPQVELARESLISSEGIVPGIAEVDWQLLLTQLVLATSTGMLGGYLLFESSEGMAGVASILFVVAIFRNSLLGALAGGCLGWFIGKKFDPFDRYLPFLLPWVGVFIGSFLGNFWRRYCPFIVQPPLAPGTRNSDTKPASGDQEHQPS